MKQCGSLVFRVARLYVGGAFRQNRTIAPKSRPTYGGVPRKVPESQQSVRDLVSAMPAAKGGFVNFGKNSSMAKEHNWALTAPELFAQTLRAWIEDKHLLPAIEDL